MDFGLLKDAPDPILLCDAVGTIQWENPQATLLFGHITGKKLEDLVRTTDLESLLATDRFYQTEVSTTLIDGSSARHLLLSVAVSWHNIDSPNFLIFFYSSANSTQPGIIESEDLIATFVHDLKNPISAVFGYADLLLDTPRGDGLNETQRELVRRIRRTSSRSVEFLRNYQHLLAFERKTLKVRPGAVSELNAATSNVIEYLWREGPLSPTLVVAQSKMPLQIMGEKSYVERIISNLVANALAYTEAGGKVSVITDGQQDTATFTIRNSSKPIPPDKMKTLFNRYRRGDTGGKNAEGSGLGLFIVKTLSELIGATVSCSSTSENGTEFTVQFKRHKD